MKLIIMSSIDNINTKLNNAIHKHKEYVAGGASGIIRIIFGYPIETIKVRMQTSSVIKTDFLNVRNLYKGATGVFFGSFLTTSIEFGAYENCKKLLMKNKISDSEHIPITYSLLSGACSGLCQVPLTTPMEHIRNRLQTAPPNQLPINLSPNLTNNFFKGSLFTYYNILKNHGIKGLYKGTMITASRDTIGTSGYFASYELTKKYMKDTNQPYITQMVGGVMAGLGFWLPIYPLDVIKNNIQIDDLSKPKYSSSFNCAKHIYKTTGIKGFYRGLSPCIIRSIPVHMAMFGTYKYITDNY